MKCILRYIYADYLKPKYITAKMLNYKKLTKVQATKWNELLLKTKANYFQYPYYAIGYDYMPYSSVEFIELYSENEIIGFFPLQIIKYKFIKIGLLIRGPVVLTAGSEKDIVTLIKKVCSKEGLMFLRITPNFYDPLLEEELNKTSGVKKLDIFPVYKGAQYRDFNVPVFKDEEALLASYKTNARRKLKKAQSEDFEIGKSYSPEVIKEAYEVFKQVSEKKKFKYRSFKSYEKIILEGGNSGLASIYYARKNGKMVNAIIVLNDAYKSTHLSSALVVDGFDPKNAPAIILHHMAIKDASASNRIYNISYSSTNSPVFEFKSLFNPYEEMAPESYTIYRNYFILKIFLIAINSLYPRLKKLIKKKHGNT